MVWVVAVCAAKILGGVGALGGVATVYARNRCWRSAKIIFL